MRNVWFISTFMTGKPSVQTFILYWSSRLPNYITLFVYYFARRFYWIRAAMRFRKYFAANKIDSDAYLFCNGSCNRIHSIVLPRARSRTLDVHYLMSRRAIKRYSQVIRFSSKNLLRHFCLASIVLWRIKEQSNSLSLMTHLVLIGNVPWHPRLAWYHPKRIDCFNNIVRYLTIIRAIIVI